MILIFIKNNKKQIMTQYEDEFEARFSYIDNDNLRKHMWDALKFITNIISIADQFSVQEKNYFYKTCILYTASIIESHIHFCLQKMGYTEIENKRIRDYKNVNVIYKDSNWDTEIISCNRKRPKSKLEGYIDFALLNTFSKQEWLYNENLYWKIEKVRKLRNQIHLMKLENINRTYSTPELNEVFGTARELFKIIESKLTTI